MFQNIEELEKQVKEFQQNILASSEFIKGIQNLTNRVESQQTEFAKDSKALLASIGEYKKYVKEQADLLIKSITEQTNLKSKEITEANTDLIRGFESKFEEYEKRLGLLFDKAKEDNVKVSEETIAAFKTINNDYAKYLNDVTVLLKEVSSQIELKYDHFIKRLENTNIGGLFAEVQDMKKTINNKFNILFAGIGVAIVLTIVSFFI